MIKSSIKIKAIIKNFDISELFSTTAEIAFYLTLSIFPSILFLISAIAYVPDINLFIIERSMSNIMPKEAYTILSAIVTSAVKNRNLNILAISFFLAAWTFSKSVKVMLRSQNRAFKFEETRSFIKINLLSIFYSIMFFIVIILCITFFVYGNKLWSFVINLIGIEFVFLDYIYLVIRFALPISMMVYLFLVFFTIGPNSKLKYSQTIPGAVVTTVLWLFFTICYSFYANTFSSYKIVYGSISAIIILMTWLYLCSMSITIGYKINALLFHQKKVDTLCKRKLK